MLIDAEFATGSNGGVVGARTHGTWLVLGVAKALKTTALFLVFSLLVSTDLPVWSFVFLFLSGLAGIYSAVHKPWTKPIRSSHWILATGYGVLLLLNLLFYFSALRASAPWKAILVIEFLDSVILSIYKKSRETRIRNNDILGIVALIFSAIVLLLSDTSISMADNDGTSANIANANTYQSIGLSTLYIILTIGTAIARKLYASRIQARFRTSGLPSGVGGGLRKDVGGKLLVTLGTAVAAALTFIPTIFQLFTHTTAADSSYLGTISATIFVTFVFAADFYVEGFARGTITQLSHSVSTFTAVFVSLILTFLFVDMDAFGFASFLSFALIFAALILTRRNSHDFDLLPTHNSSRVAAYESSAFDLSAVLSDSDSKRIFVFLVANLSFMFVEMLYGYLTNSLGLISDGFHMLFDCSALVIGLYASVMKKWSANRTYTYGYGRVQILSGFANGIFLCFIAFSVFIEAIKRLYEPPEISTEKLILVSTLGFCVNLVGLYAFHDHGGHGHSHGSKEKHAHSHDHDRTLHANGNFVQTDGAENNHDHSHNHGHSHEPKPTKHHGHGNGHGSHDEDDHDDNMYGVFLHVLADTLGSVGVIVSSTLIHFFGWWIADPIASLTISIMIGLSVIPLLKSTAQTLMHSTPQKFLRKYDICTDKLRSIEGVVDVSPLHVWAFTQSHFVGSVILTIYDGVDEQGVVVRAKEILNSFGVNDSTVQINRYRTN